MRITEGMRYTSLLQDISKAQDRSLKAQQQVSSGKKLSAPSDDPTAAIDILRLNGEKSEGEQYSRNVTFAQSKLQATDGVMDTIEQLVERARTLGQSSLSNTSSASSFVTELDGLRDQMISAANTTYGGRYIFGGSVTTTAPYVKNSNSSVTYNGNSDTMPIQTSRTSTVPTQIAGSELFSGSVNIFSVMSDLSTAMQAGDKTGIDANIQKLEQFSDVAATARTKVGSYINLTQNAGDDLQTASLARDAQLSKEEAADLATSISEFTMSQNGLQATLAVGARISQLSILDYLQ